MADVLSALRLDPRTVVSELRSLKPEAQALIAQGLCSCCRGLLSRRPAPGAPLSDSDVQGLLAAGEALVEMDAGQPRGHLLLADVLVALGTWRPGLGTWSPSLCPRSSHPWRPFCKPGETLTRRPPRPLQPNPRPLASVPRALCVHIRLPVTPALCLQGGEAGADSGLHAGSGPPSLGR